MSYDYTITVESNQKLTQDQLNELKLRIDYFGDTETDWYFTAVKMPTGPEDYEEG